MARRTKRAESRARYFIRAEAERRGWNVSHTARGGDCLEENEIASHFPDIGLGSDKPDFVFTLAGQPGVVVEAKNEAGKIDAAINEAIGYADLINATKKYRVRIAVGAAGEEDTGFVVVVRVLVGTKWKPLLAHGYEITNIPSRRETELALEAKDGTTTISLPSQAEFIDAAIALSKLLRRAKVEAPLRPKVIGALVLAMYEEDDQRAIDIAAASAIASINTLVRLAVQEPTDIGGAKKKALIEALSLTGSDFDRLAPFVGRMVALLRRLNVRSVMHTDADFLGTFYEAFLRYGYDNNALGIVFTPRHITRFCVDLLSVDRKSRVFDPACGTGGFLVSAFDKMMSDASTTAAKTRIKTALFGYDTNPTVWALALLNMFFRGDGKSNVEPGSCFDRAHRAAVRGKFTHAFLNPPFSQEGEPERDFIDAALAGLEPEGELAAVVKAGIFADEEHQAWRTEVCRQHTLLAVISLPEDLFYPTAAPTSIIVIRAHVPQRDGDRVLMARVANDGFEKLKNRRVARNGGQLPDVLAAFRALGAGHDVSGETVTTVSGKQVKGGAEFSPQQWLPQRKLSMVERDAVEQDGVRSLFQAVALMPELAATALDDFGDAWEKMPQLPANRVAALTSFFDIVNGRSSGEKNYGEGDLAYISSGDTANSIIRQVSADDDEIFPDGAVTVTAFGQAYLQPWSFVARGNGGSSVRILLPKFKMTVEDLVWFVGEINAQKWRFFYARMAIKSRLERLEVRSPPTRAAAKEAGIAQKLNEFCGTLNSLAKIR